MIPQLVRQIVTLPPYHIPIQTRGPQVAPDGI